MMVSAAAANGNTSSGTNTSATVPPGFRFHPTEEELLYYYLRKKVSYEPIDLDVLREVDLNKLEPWDLKDKCRIGSGPHNEWYFFSHKDKKYPTGTRTNRATAAGFWKATGRDKAIHDHSSSSSTRIGMRKTLVFYIGRAPHGQKTDWIMHEYRLADGNPQSKMNHHHYHHDELELDDGWVVCRVFKKKAAGNSSTTSTCSPRSFPHPGDNHDQVLGINQEETFSRFMRQSQVEPKHNSQAPALHGYYSDTTNSLVDGSSTAIHLPQLLSPESMSPASAAAAAAVHVSNPSSLSGSLDDIHYYCSQNLLSLTSGPSSGNSGGIFGRSAQRDEKLTLNGDWSFLDKLLASHQSFDQQTKALSSSFQQSAHHDLVPSTQRFPLIPFQYSEPAGCFKYSK